ncbi:uncharacterized protein EI90DRAFT_3116240 [Cantharellus anzutake]|uniref:uncharacterized protein n=1 Tax=Cantharellus anzutake TaxID=1750568 RepID=UPI001904F73F|nr:uncharacterized protein EI90DRAFT_3116240 [Cantharellus anzutake]KAF8342291.1 hypothetical protein EI90DRAFT_3116240 [Cantharellus anzutake]
MIHWKAGTFKSLESLTGDEFQASFVDDVLRTLTDKHIMPLLQAIFGDRTNNPPIDLEPIRPVIQMAYEWNKVVKSVVPPIDFRPFVFPNAGHFNAEDMDYYEKPIKAARTRVIVCAGSIGLKLHDSECPEGRVLQKVMVLTPQNYGDN